ncbi:hypothetical protein RJ641_031130 [Dillenia turbinata]|uniref:Peptidase S1 domain-containing protein n=1 Tax=Dillenia turbinata TaxID=194707 RepID=A0AAN8ZH73_9MAGN
MRVLSESWCFCTGGGKSERIKASIFSSKGPAMARIIPAADPGGHSSATGFLIHRNLLLTAHVNLPSVSAAVSAEIRLQDGVAAALLPHRFFITSSVLDLTIVGLDTEGDSNSPGQQPHYLKTCSKPNLDLGSLVYLLGYTDKKELTVGEGKVVIATDNLIKLSTDGVTWSPGSAGFDVQGNLAFMICDPMKLATSPHAKSSSTSSSSSSSWKKDLPTQFGIPIPVICDWLGQHWEGSLDELNKPKLPIIRLMSAGQKSEHSCASFTMRRVFKSTEAEDEGTPTSSNIISKPKDLPGPSYSPAANVLEEETLSTDAPVTAHQLGIPTPEIYESPKLTAGPLRKKESTPIQLLDINFPPKLARSTLPSQPVKRQAPCSAENCAEEISWANSFGEDSQHLDRIPSNPGVVDIESTASVNGAQSSVQSSSSPVNVSEVRNGYCSEEETMYSAETAESRNYTSPREGKFYQVGRSQSCVNYNRWGAAQRASTVRKALLENQRMFVPGRKVYSHGATSQRSNDYFSPTVSSIMKKRNSSEHPSKPQPSAAHSSPRWVF